MPEIIHFNDEGTKFVFFNVLQMKFIPYICIIFWVIVQFINIELIGNQFIRHIIRRCNR